MTKRLALSTLLLSLLATVFQNCSDVSFTSVAEKLTPDPCAAPGSCPVIENRIPQLVNQTISVKPASSAVDILFIVDNSGSMRPQLAELANRFPNFIASLASLDWQICVTTTDIVREDGGLLAFPNGTKWINKSTTSPETEFLTLLGNLRSGDGDERGIFAINRALDRNDGCFRPGAALSTVVISDEDERSTGGLDPASGQNKTLDARDYANSVFDTLKLKYDAAKIYSAHSIVIRPNDDACKALQAAEGTAAWFGTHYAELTRLTKGVLGNICDVNYGGQLSFIGKNIQDSLASVPLQCEPVTSVGAVVVNAASIIVSVSPAASYVATLAGNKLNFTPALPQGTVLTLKYYCQVIIPPI